ncbi:MAG TPA: MBL fold metallo-hydrolase [Candidatus Tectomicrobia bacterium]|jgi:L-ascorbate metabolism protein UlaG (beta-lactamase superfamily)|nr:MBL fold metallo-hydrolase [Candidatus Tectomicrobia bacterium]
MRAAPEITLPLGDVSSDMATGSIFFIGNATVLMRYAGFTILTDPTFVHMHEQVPLGYGLHTARLTNPAIEIDQLPPLDLIVLSHFHGDHFDHVAERELDRSLPIVTTPEAARALGERGFGHTYPLHTWSSLTVGKGDIRLRITSMPGRHGPPLSDWVLPEVMGSMLEFRSAQDSTLYRIYITGDTLVIDDLKEIPRRYSDIHLALLHLGGTRVLGVMVTMDGKQGVEAIQVVDPERAIPIHYNDYDVFTSPLSEFQREVEAAGLEERVHYLNHGETYTFNVAPSHPSP